MTRFGLIVRNLRYFRGVNLALIAGMIVATAVLTGAMMVGASVRASLAQLARNRLGPIGDALLAQRFFDQSLAQRLASDPQLRERYDIVPAILLSGGASNENETVRAGNVQIGAIGGNWLPVAQGQCVLNDQTANALSINAPGPTVLLSLPQKPDEPREAALSRRSRQDTLSAMRAGVARIDAAQDMPALFNPQGGQRLPQNAWVNLAELQDQIDLNGRVNTLLAHDRSGGDSSGSADLLNQKLRELITLEDYGVRLEKVADEKFALTSRTTYLDPALVQTAQSAAGAAHIRLQKITVNLIDAVKLQVSGKQIHYAVAAGISPLEGRDLADDQIAINQWTADQLGAKIGDRLHLTYYTRGVGGDVVRQSSDAAGFPTGFEIVKILPMSGIGADRSLTPQYKGLTDADTVADWDPPQGVQIDKRLVTKADEQYWHDYRAAPKLFLSFTAAQRLWGGPLGNVTSLRIPASSADQMRRLLHDKLDPAAMGLSFTPILAQQLAAASGNTDFGEYFVYFSFFLIVAAVLLVAMLFRLNVEQRARQIGLMAALGFGPRGLRRLALSEGMILAAVGALLGLAAAIGYTWLMIYGLRTWWNGAVGTTALYLHVGAMTLVYGFVASLVVAALAIEWAVWHVGRVSAATLLAGGWGSELRHRRGGRILRISAIVLLLIALAILGYALYDRSSASESFLSGGAILLGAGLLWLGGMLRPGVRRPAGGDAVATIPRLGIRNASRHTARSVLAIGLIAFAAFTLITVAAFRQAPTDAADPGSGTGGYRLVLQAGIPLLGDLNTVEGRRVLGMRDAADPIWKDVRFVAMRRWSGQDVSCLNLTQPTQPAILAVPAELSKPPDSQHAYRFTFAQNPGGRQDPWKLLAQPLPRDQIPVIADDNTAQYILHLNVGGMMDVRDAAGRTRQVRLVATLSNSIFQSELLMGEGNFRRLFPSVDGFSTVLVDCPAAQEDKVRQALNTELGEYAADVRTTASRLAQYQTIQNTYLSTFQALGALGLMLGTLGLAVVLVRTVIERRAELALLASLGFRRAARIWLVLSENIFLLAVGLVVGSVCAIIGIIPAVRQSAQSINAWALAATLLAVFLIGVICSSLAVVLSGVHVTPADLRRE